MYGYQAHKKTIDEWIDQEKHEATDRDDEIYELLDKSWSNLNVLKIEWKIGIKILNIFLVNIIIGV